MFSMALGTLGLRNARWRLRVCERIDEERIDAMFKDGVLRLTLPKSSPPAKKIEVKAA
jgi:HSP20 family molecular chaperone IbpA